MLFSIEEIVLWAELALLALQECQEKVRQHLLAGLAGGAEVAPDELEAHVRLFQQRCEAFVVQGSIMLEQAKIAQAMAERPPTEQLH